MEYKNTVNVAKIIACVLIASILMETITAAPVPDEPEQPSQKPKNSRNPNQRRKGNNNRIGRKNLEWRKNLFNDSDVEGWKNACGSFVWIPENANDQNQKTSYEDTKSALTLSVQTLSSSMSRMNKINTTIGMWEELHQESFKFLPQRPTGIAQKWHTHTQIYVASLTLLIKYQKKKDDKENSNQESQELQDILDKARMLLCDIEHFVNSTSNKNNKNKPYWFEKEEMAEKMTFRTQKQKHRLNNSFVKARFQSYIERLQKRIEHFNYAKNLETKAMNPHRKGSRQPKNRRNRRKSTTAKYTGEPTTTPKTFIYTTKQARRNKKVTGSTPVPQKQNRINQQLQ